MWMEPERLPPPFTDLQAANAEIVALRKQLLHANETVANKVVEIRKLRLEVSALAKKKAWP